MTTPALTAARSHEARPSRLRRGLDWLARERLAVVVPALFGSLYLAALRGLFSQDGWLALVAGREVAHGLPDSERLTVYAHGVRWVDQQWLAQLAMYGLDRLGGLALVALAHVGIATIVVALSVAVARRGGADARAVFAISLVAFVPYSFVLATVRTQIFGALAFGVVLALLVSDARRPSQRVWAVLPVLAVWANLHGSVLLGAGLVAVRGLTLAATPDGRRRGAALALGAAVAIVASPYLLHLPEYYRHTAFNPEFKHVTEWQPTTPSASNAPFYLLLFIAIWAFGRHPRELSTFEWLALLVTGVAGMAAVRNAGWFAMTAVMTLPRVFPLAPAPRRQGGSGFLIALAPVAVFAALFINAAARTNSWLDSEYPPGIVQTVERITSRDPAARVFADVRFADWLLWRDPSLAGRVAYDARYELLTAAQIDRIRRFNKRQGDGWESAAAGYRLVLVDEDEDGPVTRSLLARPGSRLAYDGPGGTVVTLGR
jgi:hypothetical protein